jgi:hypothetical protein
MVSPPSPDVLSAGDSQDDAAWFSSSQWTQVSHSSPPQLADDAVVVSGHGPWHLMTCASAQTQSGVVMLVRHRVVRKIVGFNEETAACRWRTPARVPSQLLLRCYAKESQLAVPQRRGGGYLLGEEWIRPGWTGTPLVLVRNEGSPECGSSAHPRRWGALRVPAVRGLSLRRDPRAGLRRPRVAVITTSHGWSSTSPRYQGGTGDGSPLFSA